MMNIAIDRSSDVQRVADLLDVFIQEANKGLPALAMNQHLPPILEIEQAEYSRLLLLAAADGLITTMAQRETGQGENHYAHFRHQLTKAGDLYLAAWRAKGRNDRRWPNAWLALEKSGKPLTPANLLGCLQAKAKGQLRGA